MATGERPVFAVRRDDLSGRAVRDLLALHMAGMRAHSPADSVHALDLSGLTGPDVAVWTAWAGDRIAAVGALRRLSADRAEIKSMRTHPDFLRKGAAAALLATLIETARASGLSTLSLETGSGAAFEPALSLYRRAGFRDGPAFGDYLPTAFNRFLHLEMKTG